ncbi:MAG: hypothetical protein Q8M47_10760 [Devosia sp.]|nr:hypothetical protein [Devosia sp.]
MTIRNIVVSFFLLLAFTSTAIAQNKPYVIGYDETKGLFAGVTFVHYDRGHGTQVEYMAKNGKTYLLYPGNKVVVRGTWKLERTDKPKVFNLCFKYPDNSYNPITKQLGGGWECQPAGFSLTDVVDSVDGDVLGLAKSEKVPFVLSKRKARLADLLRKVK